MALLNPACFGWELPTDRDARAALVAKLFLRPPDAARLAASEGYLCRLSRVDKRINWHLFMTDWDWSSVHNAAMQVARDDWTGSMYIGITQSLPWRWKDCETYVGNDDMCPHERKYVR